MKDIKAAEVTGALSSAKARLIWHNGRLMGYTSKGLAFDVQAELPVRRARWVGVWDCETEKGQIVIKSKCWTCGGHAKVALMSLERLLDG